MKKIRFLFDGNFEVQGRDRHFTEGQVEEVSDADAKRLIEGLCAEEIPNIKKRQRRTEGAVAQDEE
jgi:hypothetical protein